jgi:hypothetical protein
MKPSEIKNADPSAQVAALPEQLAANSTGVIPSSKECKAASGAFATDQL